jgi:hypothetical protein
MLLLEPLTFAVGGHAARERTGSEQLRFATSIVLDQPSKMGASAVLRM